MINHDVTFNRKGIKSWCSYQNAIEEKKVELYELISTTCNG